MSFEMFFSLVCLMTISDNQNLHINFPKLSIVYIYLVVREDMDVNEHETIQHTT
jgi:hypothetical protein